jgi:hypothetical protein
MCNVFQFTSVMNIKGDNYRKHYFFGYIRQLIAMHLSAFQPVILLMGMCFSVVFTHLKVQSKKKILITMTIIIIITIYVTANGLSPGGSHYACT